MTKEPGDDQKRPEPALAFSFLRQASGRREDMGLPTVDDQSCDDYSCKPGLEKRLKIVVKIATSAYAHM